MTPERKFTSLDGGGLVLRPTVDSGQAAYSIFELTNDWPRRRILVGARSKYGTQMLNERNGSQMVHVHKCVNLPSQ